MFPYIIFTLHMLVNKEQKMVHLNCHLSGSHISSGTKSVLVTIIEAYRQANINNGTMLCLIDIEYECIKYETQNWYKKQCLLKTNILLNMCSQVL